MFVTSSTCEGENGLEVLHFAVPFSSDGITQHDNWDTLGMRATGSQDISLENVFIAEEAVVARRPAGEWHPMWNVILPIAMPMIISAYMGMADTAVSLAKSVAKRKADVLAPVLGEMLNHYTQACLAYEDLVRINQGYTFQPSDQLASDVLTRKTLITLAVHKTVDLGAEIIGGPGFFKGQPMERIVRDVRASHYHPLPYRRQHLLSGRVSLGLDPVA